jgi:N-acetylmuramoyl-L-alanine amidase
MKKLLKKVAPVVLGLSLLVATPSFAYEVKQGDTMTEIAKGHGMNLQELAGLNPAVKDLDLIYTGQTIHTSKNNQQPASIKEAPVKTNVTANEKDLLARLVRAEAESEIYAGKVAVATVVLNRVDSNKFPDSINAVIYQSGQFSPVTNGSISRPADPESVKAVEEAVRLNRSELGGSLFFYNPATATSRWLDGRPTVTVIGNHVFKK